MGRHAEGFGGDAGRAPKCSSGRGSGRPPSPITTKDATAQKYFNQGLVFAYGFNHWEAQRAFQAAQKLDPECAMCFWGEALVLGPNINWPMEAAAIAPAFKAATEAQRLAPNASDKEQALIAALAKRYGAGRVRRPRRRSTSPTPMR